MPLTTTLKKGMSGPEVKILQESLTAAGFAVQNTGYFGDKTEAAVMEFQKSKGLTPDGYVGTKTWAAVSNRPTAPAVTPAVGPQPELSITDLPLTKEEYYAESCTKSTIYIHHTAGGPNAVNVVGGWEHDRTKAGNALKVATAYVIGGKDGKVKDMDGKVYKTFPDGMWAHHLGTKLANNTALNQGSVGIEVCNWGQLVQKDGKFITYVGTEVKPEDVCDLGFKFRGFQFYHRYSTAQIESLRRLLLLLSAKHDIALKKQWTAASFELSKDACAGKAGLWTHTNVRSDKNDLSPQPKLLDMLNSL